MSNWQYIAGLGTIARTSAEKEQVRQMAKELAAQEDAELQAIENNCMSPEDPAHYKGSIEHWDLCIEKGWGYFISACTKYLWRWREKNGLEDLRKARMYIDKYIKHLEANPHLLDNLSTLSQDPI